MKLRKPAALFIAVCAMFLLSCVVSAEETVPDGLIYNWGADGQMAIFGYKGSETELTIPEKINNGMVTTIKEDAFAGCDLLESITLPESVTSIERRAFEGCSSLKSIALPEKVRTLGERAFMGCSSLESITLPKGVKTLEGEMFSGCTNLKQVTLPDGILFIEHGAFMDCSSLESITLPDSVLEIADRVFLECGSLKSVHMPVNLESIGESAFSCCSSLASINLPDYLESIDEDAFYDCSSLTSLHIPESVMEIGDRAFGACSSLKEITVPGGVTDIAWETFGGCESLVNVTLSEGIINIGEQAFSGCSGLKSINLPESVESIGRHAFSYCSSLTEISFSGSAPTFDAASFEQVFATVYYPADDPTWTQDVKGQYSYSGRLIWRARCTGAHTWQPATCSVPQSCTACDELQGKVLPHSFKNGACTTCGFAEGLEYRVVFDDYVVIEGYTGNVTDMVIPATIEGKPVTEFAEGAFSHCSSLKRVSIPEHVTAMTSSFMGCENLRTIIFRGPIPGMNTYCFSGVTAEAYYPADYEIVQLPPYSGKLTWKPACAAAHTWVPASCTEPKHCSACGMPQGDALGHVYKNGTCTACGYVAVKITAQPQTVYAKYGTPAEVTVTALGDNLTYLWYEKSAGASAFIETNQTTATYSIHMADDTKNRQVYCVVKGKDGNKIKSNTVYLRQAVSAEALPKTIYTASGSTAKVEVSAKGDGLTYTWYVKNKGASAYTKSAVTKSAYSVKMSNSVKDRQVYCVVKDKYGKSVKTNTATLRMEATVISQPDMALFTKSGSTAKVAIKAAGDGLTYTWYVQNNSAQSFTKSSVTSSSYNVKMSNSTKGRVVYCVVKDKYGHSVQTNPVVLFMEATITTQPKTTYTKSGSTAKVTVKAAGDGLTYTWHIKNAGAKSYTKSSTKTAIYSVKMTDTVKDRLVYCVIKDKYGNSVKTDTVRLRMAATVTTQPKTTYTKLNATAKATVKAKGDGLTYTWYIKNAGAKSYTKSSVKTATYSIKMTDTVKDRLVYCVVKDKYGNTVKTDTVRLRMAATVTTQPKTTTVKKNATAKLTVKAKGDGLTYTWYIKNAGAKSYTKSSVKTATYSVKMTSKVKNRQVYCVVKDKYGNSVRTSTATLKMK